MRITAELKNALLIAANVQKGAANIELYQAQQKVDYAERSRQWAANLVVGDELPITGDTLNKFANVDVKSATYHARTLYFFASKSGLSKGHYIKQEDSSISCSCPGFLNRSTCWAIKEVLKGNGSTRVWSGSRQVFENNREEAINSFLRR